MSKLRGFGKYPGYVHLVVVFALGVVVGRLVVFGLTDDDIRTQSNLQAEQVNPSASPLLTDLRLVNLTGTRNDQGACENPGVLERQLELGKAMFVGLLYVDDATCTFQLSIGTIVGDIPNEMTTETEEETAVSP